MANLGPASRILSRRMATTGSTSTSTPSLLCGRHSRHNSSTSYSPLSLPLSSRYFGPPQPQLRRQLQLQLQQSKPNIRKLSTTSTLHEAPTSSSSSSSPSDSTSDPTPSPSKSTIPPSKIYTFEEIQSLSTNPTSNVILIDVREPSELLGTGHIPTARNVPISTAPDSFFLPADEFEDRFGFPRPGEDTEVVFYCKAGVRSKAAARLAGQAGFGGKVGEFPGSWVEWFDKGGRVERED